MLTRARRFVLNMIQLLNTIPEDDRTMTTPAEHCATRPKGTDTLALPTKTTSARDERRKVYDGTEWREGASRSATLGKRLQCARELAPTPVALRIRKIKEDPRAAGRRNVSEDSRTRPKIAEKVSRAGRRQVCKRHDVIDTIRNEIPLSRRQIRWEDSFATEKRNGVYRW